MHAAAPWIINRVRRHFFRTTRLFLRRDALQAAYLGAEEVAPAVLRRGSQREGHDLRRRGDVRVGHATPDGVSRALGHGLRRELVRNAVRGQYGELYARQKLNFLDFELFLLCVL